MQHLIRKSAATLLLFAALLRPAGAIVGASEPGAPNAAGIVMVLSRMGDEAGFCTAVVLSKFVVLTAAHCAPPGADLRVHYPEPGAQPVLFPVASVVRHPGYRADAIRTRQRSIDLALLRLGAPLPDRFTALSIATDSGAQPGDAFTISGFGLTREGDSSSSGQLRSAGLAARSPISSVLLWAGTGGSDGGACTGDSGAPVTRRGSTSVVALTVWSAGLGRRRCGDLTQAVWLAPQREWINSVLVGWRP